MSLKQNFHMVLWTKCLESIRTETESGFNSLT